MATEFHMMIVEQAIDYIFNSRALLRLALTAPGSEEENHDGSRALARLGQATMSLVVADRGYEQSIPREGSHALQKLLDSKKQLASAAQYSGIAGCIKLCERSGPASASVVRDAVRAIIGATWKDSKSLDTVLGAMESLNISLDPDFDPVPITIEPMRTLKNASVFAPEASPRIHQVAQVSGDSMFHPEQVSLSDNQNSRRPTGNSTEELHSERDKSAIGDCTTWLRLYTADEQERCMKHDMRGPSQTFLAQAWMDQIADLKHSGLFLKIWASICSAETVVALQETLELLRSQQFQLELPYDNLSAADRFHAIEKVEHQIAGLDMLKRYHVLRLWEEHRHCQPSKHGWVWVDAKRSVDPDAVKRPGNRHNQTKARITKLLMARIYPDVKNGSSEYDRKYSTIKRVGKLGQRLSLLTDKFGLGILGFIQSSRLNSATSISLTVTDGMLSKPSDADFGQFITVLDSAQGDALRAFSTAAAPMIECILRNTLRQRDPFPLELALPDYILSLPKGSSALLAIMK